MNSRCHRETFDEQSPAGTAFIHFALPDRNGRLDGRIVHTDQRAKRRAGLVKVFLADAIDHLAIEGDDEQAEMPWPPLVKRIVTRIDVDRVQDRKSTRLNSSH